MNESSDQRGLSLSASIGILVSWYPDRKLHCTGHLVQFAIWFPTLLFGSFFAVDPTRSPTLHVGPNPHVPGKCQKTNISQLA